ncbi:MAG: hypothetical protein K2M46_03025 [Lachnospiraceae bacterium]|nr:hypothetical protein [Lachnospiraceae bacterium]
MPIIHYLHTAIVSGYLKKEQWQFWADERIVQNNELDEWIYDVSIAKSKEEVCNAIAYYKTIEAFDKNTFYWEPDVVIGYYYIRYINGTMSLSELLFRLYDEDDVSSEAELLSIPEVMSVLSEAKMGNIDSEKINELFLPLEKIARKQLEELDHYLKNTQ